LNIFKKIILFILYHSKNYKKVLSLTAFDELDKNIKINSQQLRYQAYSSNYTKNYRHAKMCLELLEEYHKMNDKDYNLLACLHARHNDKDKAISYWCMALEKNKYNKRAKKALDYIREKGREINLIEDDFFDNIFPKQPFYFPLKYLFVIFLFIIIAALLSFGAYFGYNYYKNNLKYISNEKYDKINDIKLPDYNPNLLDSPKEKNKKYSYNENEIKAKYNKIRKYILNNDAVNAQIEINQIKLSNASLAVKNKISIFENFIDEPDPVKFKNLISYDDFIKEKILYNNVYILWEGRIVNLSINEERIKFDLVIGNNDAGTIKGIIPVIFKKYIKLQNNEIVKIFGIINVNKDLHYIEGKYCIKN